MATADSVDIQGVDLTDDSYTVEQSLIRNKYAASDADGNTVLRGKQKTAYEIMSGDWSSDVCSSDLLHRRAEPDTEQVRRLRRRREHGAPRRSEERRVGKECRL